MQDLQRRTVLLGAGVLVGLIGAPSVRAVPARAEPDPNDVPDLALLRRTFVLADEASTERWRSVRGSGR